MNSSPADPVLPIVIVPIKGGKPEEPRQPEPPDLRHWQIDEFLRQTGKSDNTQRVYRGQLIRFAAWCDQSWLDVTSSDIGKYQRELKLKGLKATSVNHALNTRRMKTNNSGQGERRECPGSFLFLRLQNFALLRN